MTHYEAVHERIAFWEQKSVDAVRAAEYANRQFRLAVEELAALGGMAMGETPPELTLIIGGKA